MRQMANQEMKDLSPIPVGLLPAHMRIEKQLIMAFHDGAGMRILPTQIVTWGRAGARSPASKHAESESKIMPLAV
jgi:hypothetical protein